MESNVKKHLENTKTGSVSLEEFVERVRKKIKKIQGEFSPFISIPQKLKIPGEKGPLYGLPVSVKDNLCTKGIQTTAGSKILTGYVPGFDAACVKKAKKEGSLIIGKTAMDEFGFGTFSVNCAFQTPKNPVDKNRTCGGSSGGAACIVKAADFPTVSIAESTGGSISCPAAFTGTVGLTPTYGRVSRWGLVDFANSMDKIGAIGKRTHDVALLLSIISGYDSRDSTTVKKPAEDFTKHLDKRVKGLKLGIPKEYFSSEVSEKIRKKTWKAIKELECLGAEYKKISLPLTEPALTSYYLIAVSESSTNLAKFCGIRYGLHTELKGNFEQYFSKVRENGFGSEAKRRIMLGTYARMAGYRDKFYLKALKVRAKVIQEFKKAFKEFDALAAPTMPILPPKFSEINKLKPVEHYLMDKLVAPPNLAGIPMLSIPSGLVKKLPVGLHLMADHFEEKKLLGIASALEEKQ